MLFASLNSDNDFTSLSCEEIHTYENTKRNAFPHDETKDHDCGLTDRDIPRWFSLVDKNHDGIVQLEEFDEDLAKVSNVEILVETLNEGKGILQIDLGKLLIIKYYNMCLGIIYQKMADYNFTSFKLQTQNLPNFHRS